MEASLSTFILSTPTPAPTPTSLTNPHTPHTPAPHFQCPGASCPFRSTSSDPERAIKRHILAISKDPAHSDHASHVILHKQMEDTRRPTPAKTKASQDRYRAANRQKRSDAARYCQLKRKIRLEGVVSDEREIEEKARAMLKEAQDRRAERERELREKFGAEASQAGKGEVDAVGEVEEGLGLGLEMEMEMEMEMEECAGKEQVPPGRMIDFAAVGPAGPGPQGAGPGPQGPARKMRMLEVCEMIRAAYYDVEQEAKNMPVEQAEGVITRWLEGLEMVSKGFVRANGPYTVWGSAAPASRTAG